MGVRFVKPNINLVTYIADNMRAADADEVWASNRHTPVESLMKGWNVSDFCTVAVVNDDPCVMFGLVVQTLMGGQGVPWLLGADNVLKYKQQFFHQTPKVVDEMLRVCPRLVNYVHDQNTVSIKWLRWAGFTMGDPAPYGVGGDLFRRFHKERCDDV